MGWLELSLDSTKKLLIYWKAPGVVLSTLELLRFLLKALRVALGDF